MSFGSESFGAGGIGGIHAAILAKDRGVQLHSFLTSKLLSYKASRAGLADRSPVHLGSFLNNATPCSFAPNTTHEEVAIKVLEAPVYKVLKQAIDSNELQPLSVHAKMIRGELVNPPWGLEREPHRRLSV